MDSSLLTKRGISLRGLPRAEVRKRPSMTVLPRNPPSRRTANHRNYRTPRCSMSEGETSEGPKFAQRIIEGGKEGRRKLKWTKATVIENRAASVDGIARILVLSIEDNVEYLDGRKLKLIQEMPRWIDEFCVPGQFVGVRKTSEKAVSDDKGAEKLFPITSSPNQAREKSALLAATILQVLVERTAQDNGAGFGYLAPGDVFEVTQPLGRGFASLFTSHVELQTALEEMRELVMVCYGAMGLGLMRSALNWTPVMALATAQPVTCILIAPNMTAAACVPEWDEWRGNGVKVVSLFENGLGATDNGQSMESQLHELLFRRPETFGGLIKYPMECAVLIAGLPSSLSSYLTKEMTEHGVLSPHDYSLHLTENNTFGFVNMSTSLLHQFGLTRNPFTDRIAEKTQLDPDAVYMRSDLVDFTPNDTTYLFFGKRGSGKTTIRLMMQRAYQEYNESPKEGSSGHYMVDLCTPGHLTTCLSDFKEVIGASMENWDAQFRENWFAADVVDCILSYVATELMREIANPNINKQYYLTKLQESPREATQFLLLTHLYARTDAASLAAIRKRLIPQRYIPQDIQKAAATTGVIAGGALGSKLLLDTYGDRLYDAACSSLPGFEYHDKWYGAACVLGMVAIAKIMFDRRREQALSRARELQSCIRVVKPKATSIVARLLSQCFQTTDTIDSIRSLCIGISGHQKLERLRSLVQLFGYESLAVFGDSFDEVALLDPVRFPDALKVFAREACRNDLLNFGRLHFFFPDSRLGLDLSTDKMLKEARFDRHFVRDLTWSRHQLQDLAERRFRAAQKSDPYNREFHEGDNPSSQPANASFSDLFKKARGEDFLSYIVKLSTPRELMIVMSEMFTRMEAYPEEGLTAQYMEIAVTKALEQSV